MGAFEREVEGNQRIDQAANKILEVACQHALTISEFEKAVQHVRNLSYLSDTPNCSQK